MRCDLLAFCPDIEFIRGAKADFAQARRALDGQLTEKRWFHHIRLSDGRDYIRWPKLSEFLIAPDGHRVVGRPLTEISQTTFQTYLLSQVLSFALLRQGLESLHATAVVIQGKAVAFLGDCGDGKSTLAAACLKEGFPLLTDDLLVLKPDNGRLLAYPGLPRIKLMPGIARRLLGAQVRGCPMNPFTSKRVVPLAAHQYASSPVSLDTLYVLRSSRTRTSSRTIIRRLSARQAWLELTKGTFNLVVREPDRLQAQFAWASRLAQQIPVKALSYPRRLRDLPRVVQAVAADVVSCR